MIRTFGLGLAIVALAAGNIMADEKDDFKAMKGVWKIEKAVFQGSDSTDAFKSAVLTIEESKYSVSFAGQEDKGTLKLDAGKKPKQMTITGVEGPSKDKTLVAIYEIDGDTMKICYELEGKEPPAKFESAEGTKTLFVVYKREKK